MKIDKWPVILFLFAVILGGYLFSIKEREADPFRYYMNMLEQRKSIRDIQVSQDAILHLGPTVVPRLVSELNVISNLLVGKDLFIHSDTNGIVPTTNSFVGKTMMARENIYNLICMLDVNIYQQMVIASCQSDNHELCAILDAASPEKLFSLPKDKLSELTNTLADIESNPESDLVERSGIKRLFERLAFSQNQFMFRSNSRRRVTNE